MKNWMLNIGIGLAAGLLLAVIFFMWRIGYFGHLKERAEDIAAKEAVVVNGKSAEAQ